MSSYFASSVGISGFIRWPWRTFCPLGNDRRWMNTRDNYLSCCRWFTKTKRRSSRFRNDKSDGAPNIFRQGSARSGGRSLQAPFERKQQTPLTKSLILTPACEARQRALVTSSSTSALIMPKMAAGLPLFAWSISRSIISRTNAWRALGAALIFFSSGKTETPVSRLNSSALSFVISGSHVSNPKSS
jgi:hypothetical protein